MMFAVDDNFIINILMQMSSFHLNFIEFISSGLSNIAIIVQLIV